MKNIYDKQICQKFYTYINGFIYNICIYNFILYFKVYDTQWWISDRVITYDEQIKMLFLICDCYSFGGIITFYFNFSVRGTSAMGCSQLLLFRDERGKWKGLNLFTGIPISIIKGCS